MIRESLFAASERETRLDKLGDVLRRFDELIDFAEIAHEVEQSLPQRDRSKGGRPPYPVELMVRVMIVQEYFNLSDEQMEFQLLDRLSFQRFVGLRRSSQIPDRTTIWLFRERLVKAGCYDGVLESVNRQINAAGYVARGGQMIDATLVSAPIQRMSKEENEAIEQGKTPADWAEAKRRQKDMDARWTKKHGKSHFGYKMSASVDHRYKLLRKVKVSSANEHDTKHFEDVLDGDNSCRDVYADRGYADREREHRLRSEGWRMHIQRKAKKGKPLSPCQAKRNRRIASKRARVEHPFASMAQMGGKAIRCIGLERARLRISLKAAVYNIQRLCYLKSAGVLPLKSRIAA
ncbi:IS5 family transposase [Mariprofundus ferrooxydans]|jgi:IS5 family transposase|uniref:Transposase, IS5 family protein n=2 Tax=Mariprofundus ferrooxydans TaxID=314344 RepID=Q0EYQ5_9PROT|nr:IS5 family transposase [Mariprofundus ferrooxydans]EAU54502.1 transposase, IS5 family protein [Mariprofundus ferrooxydans PV-1]EAU55008.1 transposase, IS5 family protein [Mariprofundus ferrooxydans PV-1]KON46337.1 transposase [Mariprofundus ferrooxydans]